MAWARRIILFVAVNLLVIITLSIVMNLFHLQPFLQGYGLNLRSLLIFCMLWGMAGALISLALSRQMAKWMMRVKVVSKDTPDSAGRQLVQWVEELSRAAGLSAVPEVGIFTSTEPNAFATGPTQKRSLVAVSTGLMQKMSPDQLKGVLAHEISHIANGDMVTMTLLQGVINAFVMFLARVLAFVVSGIGKNRNQNSSGSYFSYMAFVFLFEIVFMILGSLVVCFFSRVREFKADQGGADLAGTDKMISALEALQRMQQIHDPETDKPALAAFKIATQKKRGWLSLFATHPPLEERIARLKHY